MTPWPGTTPTLGKIGRECCLLATMQVKQQQFETSDDESPTQKIHRAHRRGALGPASVRYAQFVGSRYPSAGDQKLIQIVDSALAETTRQSGDLLVCKKGCTQCCVGVFAINQLDAARLQRGLAVLEKQDPARADEIRRRARDAWKELAADFPGDKRTGILDESEKGKKRFEDFANDEPCPALNPADGTCDLYQSRPMTCRVFGPPIRSEEGLGACELCYHGVPDEKMEAYEMIPDPDDLEAHLLKKFEKTTRKRGNTIIVFCLAT